MWPDWRAISQSTVSILWSGVTASQYDILYVCMYVCTFICINVYLRCVNIKSYMRNLKGSHREATTFLWLIIHQASWNFKIFLILRQTTQRPNFTFLYLASKVIYFMEQSQVIHLLKLNTSTVAHPFTHSRIQSLITYLVIEWIN